MVFFFVFTFTGYFVRQTLQVTGWTPFCPIDQSLLRILGFISRQTVNVESRGGIVFSEIQSPKRDRD